MAAIFHVACYLDAMTPDAAHPRIARDPAIMTGKACIAGTRIPVDLILRKLAAGEERAQLLADYPALTEEDIDAALTYAASVVAGDRPTAAE